MRIAILGAGAMGSIFGGRLAGAGNDVTLIDVWREAVEAIEKSGLCVEDKDGQRQTFRVRAVTEPQQLGPVELLLVCVKCYQTEAAVRSALPLIGAGTVVLSLQNGWGNAPRIAEIVGPERVLVGVTYHSATVLGPGHVRHAGQGQTLIGELDGRFSARLERIGRTLTGAGFEVSASEKVLEAIWAKLALNACTLPTSALLRFSAGQLVEHAGTLELMRAVLREVVAVANARGIALDEGERWAAITGLLQRAAGAKPSMLQDIEKRRRTEIDVINGAVVAAGRALNLPTPYNQTMCWLIESLEATFET